MAVIPAPEQQADSADAVLAAVREARAAADREEVRILELAREWAAMHEIDEPSSPLLFEQPARFTGKGVPEVGEFCVPELATVLHISTEAAGSLIAEALELVHRLPRVWARVKAGKLAPWRARRIAARTTFLPPEGAEYVDRHVARFAHKVGIAQLDRLVEEALVRFDPETAEKQRLAAADGRHVTLYTGQVGFDGTVHLQGELDLADALDLDQALSDGAARLAELGCTDSLDVRRAHALGEMARSSQPTLDLPAGTAGTDGEDAPAEVAGPRRQVVLHVHLSEAALGDTISVAALRRLACDAEIVPAVLGSHGEVLDVGRTQRLVTNGIWKALTLRDKHCRFPGCRRMPLACDAHHLHHWADGGDTSLDNLVLLRLSHESSTSAKSRCQPKTWDGWPKRVRPGPRAAA